MVESGIYNKLYEDISQGLDVEEAICRMEQLPTTQEDAMYGENVSDRVVEIVSQVLMVNKDDVNADSEFCQLGFDEVMKKKLLDEINQTFQLQIQASEFYLFQSLGDMIQRIEAVPLPETNETMLNSMIGYLKNQLGKLIKLDPYRINEETPVGKYGVDSIVMLEWIGILGDTFDALPKTLMFEYQTIRQLALYLLENHKEAVIKLQGIGTAKAPVFKKVQEPVEKVRKSPLKSCDDRYKESGCLEEEIAIIGMSCKFPKSNSTQQFFEHLLDGKDLVTAVDKDRWDMNQYQNLIRCGWGGFLDDVDKFDPMPFGILPTEAHVIDPMSRLFLESVSALLESSGLTKAILAEKYDKKVGVYAGAMYQQYQLEQGDLVQESFTSVNSFSSIANRVSYCYDFQGPSVAVDTMCSSSSVAIHMACESLRHNECRLAIAGGVNLSIHPKKYIGLTKSGVIASGRESRSFADGDGYIPCEGVGAVLLKQLKHAVLDGDEIIAVIKATSVNHNGHTNGYMVPSQVTQRTLMETNFQKCGISPASISYVEAAANGSPLGDSIEVDALKRFYESKTDKKKYCVLGSVKSNLGHPEAVSGIAQIIKAAMQLKSKVIVPSIYLKRTNLNINLEGSPFYFVEEKKDWDQPFEIVDGVKKKLPRRAMIDSIGAGGTNVNMILEEYSDDGEDEIPDTKLSKLFVFSAVTQECLQQVIGQMLIYIKEHPEVSLPRLAYTLQVRKESMDVKMAIISETVNELTEKLEKALKSPADTAGLLQEGVYIAGDKRDLTVLQHLLGGGLREKFIKMLVEEEPLDKIALLFVNGPSVTFQSFYNKIYRPVKDLPTYPFRRESYWITKMQREENREEDIDEETDLYNRNAISSGIYQLIEICSGLHASDLTEDKTLEQYGFNSIQLLELKSRLEKKYQFEIPVTSLNGSNTVRDIISSIAGFGGREQQEENVLPEIKNSGQERYEEFPLNDIQESFYIGRKMKLDGDKAGAHIFFEFKVADPDIKKLNMIWNALAEHYDCLHTKITQQGTQKERKDIIPYQFKILDLQRDHEDRIHQQLESIRTRMSHKIYSLEEEYYYEIRISLLPNKEAIVHFSIDELITDATSIQILLQQWKELYEGVTRELPKIKVTFRDYVLAVRDFEKTKRYQNDLAYWVKRLAHMPNGPVLWQDDGIKENKNFRKRLQYKFSKEKWELLKEKAMKYKVSATVLMLTLFGQFLKEKSGQEEFSLLLTYYNRLPIHDDIEYMIGPFISTSIFVVDGCGGIKEQLTENQNQLFQDLDHNTVSGIHVMRELKQLKKQSRDFYLPVVFTSLIHNFSKEEANEAHTFFSDIEYMVTQTPQVFLDHQLYEKSGQLIISWDIAYQYFGENRSDELFNSYCDFINQFIAFDATSPYPLTDMQYAYAYGRNKEAGSIANCQFYQEIDFHEFDRKRFVSSWNFLIKRHPMLRTRIIADGTQQTMNIAALNDPVIHDLRKLTRDEQEDKLQEIKDKISGEAFVIDSWPLFCVEIALISPNEARVYFAIDMLIADGFSIQSLLEQLITVYETNELLTPLEYTFEEYVKTVSGKKDGSKRDREYWENKFRNLSSGPALYDENLLNAGNQMKREHKTAVVDGWQYVQQEAEKRDVSKGMILFTVYAEVISRFIKEKFTIVVPSWQRPGNHPDIKEVIGDFTQMSWITVDPLDQRSFIEKLKSYDRVQKEDLLHRPSEAFKVLRKATLRNRMSLKFPIVFTDLFPISEFKLPNTITMGFKISNTPSVYLDQICREEGDQLLIQWDGIFGIFKRGVINQMVDYSIKVLETLADSECDWDSFCAADILKDPKDKTTKIIQ